MAATTRCNPEPMPVATRAGRSHGASAAHRRRTSWVVRALTVALVALLASTTTTDALPAAAPLVRNGRRVAIPVTDPLAVNRFDPLEAAASLTVDLFPHALFQGDPLHLAVDHVDTVPVAVETPIEPTTSATVVATTEQVPLGSAAAAAAAPAAPPSPAPFSAPCVTVDATLVHSAKTAANTVAVLYELPGCVRSALVMDRDQGRVVSVAGAAVALGAPGDYLKLRKGAGLSVQSVRLCPASRAAECTATR
ncbi:hypothetical protein AMAG_04298 [Allomyces macrogynus ATCC 38327]|uniref:Uncharacterized protein n=1 Tax=Allomyces macrogynus (strain ATCC 38327) TaxID=578462 RepID=A0A0L0S8M9_ALLM3|nr:hypothetical protein AMAG_04298 [Allomyces macrogynus ATCC 38327]|eukprot:KNE58744.1 hypothetical protein AMAG_04298 [Allomyces macrogynus ATCC 38327]